MSALPGYSGRHRRAAVLVNELGYPAPAHPESLARELAAADEEWIETLAGQLWPAGEYVDIITGYDPELPGSPS